MSVCWSLVVRQLALVAVLWCGLASQSCGQLIVSENDSQVWPTDERAELPSHSDSLDAMLHWILDSPSAAVDDLTDEPPGVGSQRIALLPLLFKLSDRTLGKTAGEPESSPKGENTDAHREPIDSEPAESPTLPPLTPREMQRQDQVQRCLSMYFRLPVDTEKWRPWTIMHGLLPYGRDSIVVHKGRRYNAAEYLCQNGIGNDMRLMYLSKGEMALQVGPGVQGHEGQFLAMLAQSEIPLDAPIHIQGQAFTVADLVEYEKQSCRQNSELTFKLIGLSHYLDSDLVWRNSLGQAWNIERLIYEEIKQPINGAACGGTHRLMGLSYAVNRRAMRNEPLDGQWGRAAHFIGQYQDFAMRYQNSDGSFSTNWFVTQEADYELKKRLYTTGHILEWLVYSLPAEKLRDPRLNQAVDYLLNLMLTASALDLELGPRGHALHALRLYELRMTGRNSDVENISPADLAVVEKALWIQKQLKPGVESSGGLFGQNIGFQGMQNGTSSGGRRGFRRW